MPVTQARQTRSVVEKHLNAFGTGDIDAIMADYADDAVFVTADSVLQGTEEIRTLFEKLLDDLPPGSPLTLEQQQIQGELAFLVWSGESDTVQVHFATDTLIVRDGKITMQTFAAHMEKKERS